MNDVKYLDKFPSRVYLVKADVRLEAQVFWQDF